MIFDICYQIPTKGGRVDLKTYLKDRPGRVVLRLDQISLNFLFLLIVSRIMVYGCDSQDNTLSTFPIVHVIIQIVGICVSIHTNMELYCTLGHITS